jgi:hypothetical protein
LKIIEELVRNKIKRDEIIFDNVPEILNKDRIETQKDEISFFDKPENIFDKVKKLFAKEQQIHLENIDTFDISDEKFYGINRNTIQKYAEVRSEVAHNITALPTYWVELFGSTSDFKVYKTESFFASLARVLNETRNSVNGDKYTVARIKSDILRFEPSDGKMLVDMYRDQKSIPSVETLSQLEEVIESETYTGTIVDIEICAEIYHLTFVAVDKTGGIRIIAAHGEYQKEGFVFLYYHIYKDRELYDLIFRHNTYRFVWGDIPPAVQELLTPLMITPVAIDTSSEPKKVRIKIKRRK